MREIAFSSIHMMQATETSSTTTDAEIIRIALYQREVRLRNQAKYNKKKINGP